MFENQGEAWRELFFRAARRHPPSMSGLTQADGNEAGRKNGRVSSYIAPHAGPSSPKLKVNSTSILVFEHTLGATSDQPTPNRFRDRPRQVVHLQFLINGPHMHVDGVVTDRQFISDLLFRVAFRQQA